MKITYEMLVKKDACKEGLEWFKTTFPDGCELNDETINNLCSNEYKSGYIWWFYNNVQQDARLYRLCGVNRSYGVNWSDGVNWSNGVNGSNGVNRSDGVNGSYGVNRSYGVNWSDGVNWSNGVNGSNGVNRSDGVNGSNGVNRSDGVNRSYGVNWSDGVNESDGVNRSDGVNGSNGVNRSDGVDWSNGVNRSDGVNGSNGVNRSDGVDWSAGINESFGVINSYGVDHALFLADKPREYTIFGSKVSKGRFSAVQNTLLEKLNGWRPVFNNIKALWLANGSDWQLTPIQNAEELSKQEAWSGMPKEAIDYVASLPEFDADMFFKITGITIKNF